MKRLFLDLEDTVITPVLEGWQNTEMINVELIKKVIHLFKPDVIDIFSFAISDEKEKQLFNQYCRPMIEQSLGVTLFTVPTTDNDIIKACCAQKNINPKKVDFSDLSDFWGKQLSFNLWCEHHFKNPSYPVQCLFLDDAVSNSYIKSLDNSFDAFILNVDDLALNFDKFFAPVFLKIQEENQKIERKNNQKM